MTVLAVGLGEELGTQETLTVSPAEKATQSALSEQEVEPLFITRVRVEVTEPEFLRTANVYDFALLPVPGLPSKDAFGFRNTPETGILCTTLDSVLLEFIKSKST